MTNLWIGEFENDEINKIEVEKRKDFSKLIRILSSKFFREECISSIILSSKLSYDSKLLHYKGLRDICQLLFLLATYSHKH